MVITHDIQAAFHIADKIAMLHEGRIVEDGPPAAFRRSANPVVQAFVARAEQKEVR